MDGSEAVCVEMDDQRLVHYSISDSCQPPINRISHLWMSPFSNPALHLAKFVILSKQKKLKNQDDTFDHNLSPHPTAHCSKGIMFFSTSLLSPFSKFVLLPWEREHRVKLKINGCIEKILLAGGDHRCMLRWWQRAGAVGKKGSGTGSFRVPRMVKEEEEEQVLLETDPILKEVEEKNGGGFGGFSHRLFRQEMKNPMYPFLSL